MSRFAILDPVLDPTIAAWAAKRAEPAIPLWPVSEAPGMTGVTPWLMEGSPDLQQALSSRGALPWGLWLESDADLLQLPQRLADRRIMRDETGNPLLLRWWDKDVLGALWPVLTPAERAWWLAGLHRIIVSGTPEIVYGPITYPPAAGLNLDSRLRAALAEDMVRRRTVQIDQWLADTWKTVEASTRVAVARRAAQSAQALGLADLRDWIALAQLMGNFGAGLLDDPLYASLLSDLDLIEDRTRLWRCESLLLPMAQDRQARDREIVGSLRQAFTSDVLVQHLIESPKTALTLVFGPHAELFDDAERQASQTASTNRLRARYPTVTPADELRFWLVNLLLGAGFETDPLRAVPAQAYAQEGLLGLHAWAVGSSV
jgi:hypothetical protein